MKMTEKHNQIEIIENFHQCKHKRARLGTRARGHPGPYVRDTANAL